jgi:hypothetical protein
LSSQKSKNPWDNAKRVTLKSESYRILVKLKDKLKAKTWEQLINKLAELIR